MQAPTSSLEPRPNIDIGVLNAFLESIRSFDPGMIFVEGPLFHYTDLAGLQGIVSNQDLWLTHSRYSNDDEELLHGYRVAREAVEVERERSGRARNRRTYLKALDDLLATPTPEGVYVCCFCQDDNLLSQWRSYGANGTGVSIEIDPEGFSNVTGPDSPSGGLMRLWEVFYERDRQERIVKRAIDFFFEHQPTLPPQERARQAADAIQFFIPTFKNADFRQERECRLIFTPPPSCAVRPQFRVGRGMLVPHYSLKALCGTFLEPSWKLPIKGVRVGPTAQKVLNAESAQMLLREAGYSDIVVDSSATPYRG